MELKRVEKRHVQKQTIDDIENLREQSIVLIEQRERMIMGTGMK